MNIQFDNQELIELQEVFNAIDPEQVIFMNHYELANETGISADKWKQFLMHPQVSTWMQQELQLFKEYQLKQMIKNATDNEKSVGAAQMINSLTKTLQEGRTKEGPIIIYTHVPLTMEQQAGTTVETVELTENILAAIPEEWED